MASSVTESVTSSRTYRLVRTLRRWAGESVVASLLGHERVLIGALATIVLVSVGSVLRSSLGAGVKFLSFALLFVCLAWLTARFVDPPGE